MNPIKRTTLSNRRNFRRLRAACVMTAVALLASSAAAGLAARGWRHDPAEDVSPAAELLPGELDLTFGVDGTVAIDFGNHVNDSALAVTAQPDGKVVTVGMTFAGATGQDFAVTRLNQNGSLDSTFGDGGRLIFNFDTGGRDDVARAVAVQPDGKIVVAGEADVAFGNFDIAVARLNPDGTFDTSFGGDGKVVTGLPDNRADFGRDLALQTDGRIVVAGYSNRPTSGDDFVVVRYNADGSLDAAFDGDGVVTTDILTNREDRASSLVLQPGGDIVVAGHTDDPAFRFDFAVVRYNPNGSLDHGFNGTGKVTTDLNVGGDDFGNAVALHGDGRLVVAGQSASDFGLVRYNADGSPDATFGGGDGIVITNFGANDIGRGVVVQGNGKTTVAGRSRTELALARYNLDGTPDASFDGDGLMVRNAGNNFISAFGGYWGMSLQANGKILAAGEGWRDGSGIDFTVSRLNANGTYDFTFDGGDGIASTDVHGRYDEAESVALQPDGKIVAAGSAQNATGGFDFAVVRYHRNGTPDASFGGDGIVTTDIRGNRDERGHAVAVQPDGKIVVAGQTDNAVDGNLDDGVLIRYHPNGTLDASFGDGGIVITPGVVVNPNRLTWLRTRSIALQPDGKIVVAGQASYFSISRDGFVARYNTDGTLDSSFGRVPPNGTQGGTITIDFNTSDTLNAVALQADGKVVVAGSADTGTSFPSTDFVLARLTTGGMLDTSFGGDGKVFTNFDNNDFDAAADLVIQPDGKILAVGTTNVNGGDFAAARYHPGGSLDASFGGGDGTVNVDFAGRGDSCHGVALQPNGKILLAGVFSDFPFVGGFAAAKLNADGTLDRSFGGGDGKTTTSLGDAVVTALGPEVYDMALQPDGQIVLAGKANFNSTDSDFTLVRYVNSTLACTYTINPTGADLPAGGGAGSFNVSAPAGCSWRAQSNVTWLTTESAGSGNGVVQYSAASNALQTGRTGTLSVGGRAFTVEQAGDTNPTVQFTAATFGANESARRALLTVGRTGNTASASSVNFATADGTADRRRDYTQTLGTLNFAPGETSKTITVLVTDDVFPEPVETFAVTLSDAAGATLGARSTATVNVTSDDSVLGPNPVDAASFNATFFVRQHYADFLNREPDAGGLAFWTNNFTQCAGDQQCLDTRRVNVSAAFFLSIEFQETGFLVYRIFKTAFGDAVSPGVPGTVPVVRLEEFLPGTQRIGEGVRVGIGNWQQQLDANKNAYALDFVGRQRFRDAFPASLTPTQFVDRLNLNAGNVLTAAARGQLIAGLTADNTARGRAGALRAVAESQLLRDREFRRAFVLMQYFGYLRRNPDDGGNRNFGGWRFWLGKLDDNGGDFVRAEMVKAFLLSLEYKNRFGQ